MAVWGELPTTRLLKPLLPRVHLRAMLWLMLRLEEELGEMRLRGLIIQFWKMGSQNFSLSPNSTL